MALLYGNPHGASSRGVAFHPAEDDRDLDSAVSLRWISFRMQGTRSHFRTSEDGRILVHGYASFANLRRLANSMAAIYRNHAG
jgi:hypothetical protein